jgi:hypothetical protein
MIFTLILSVVIIWKYDSYVRKEGQIDSIDIENENDVCLRKVSTKEGVLKDVNFELRP